MEAWGRDTRGLWDGGLGVRCLEAGESSGRDTSRFGVRGPRGEMPLARRARRLEAGAGRAWGERLDIGAVVASGAMPQGRRKGDLEA
ncbi:hypothetical protein EJD97_023126 [Solanum chilense]|uniref:Uncharacterized protein n=1 Tax=Solanum chilense TaxID=4083 RepID=A0A6N2CAT9_SOLCI|nr:hypothetical protein EJD97_023126 [Solanum chilense]